MIVAIKCNYSYIENIENIKTIFSNDNIHYINKI